MTIRRKRKTKTKCSIFRLLLTMVRSLVMEKFLAVLLIISCTSVLGRGRQGERAHLHNRHGTDLCPGDDFVTKRSTFNNLGPSHQQQQQPGTAATVTIYRGGAKGGKIKQQAPNGKPQSLLQKYPFASAVTITTCNAIAADLLTQCVLESTRDLPTVWNPRRTGLFAAFGFLFQGCAQYAIVNMFWERLFPGTDRNAIFCKIVAMNVLSDPLLFFPVFYIFKETLSSQQALLDTIQSALQKYKSNCRQDWRNSWMIWFPGHAVTYGVMRPHQRIPWMAFLSFFYMCILSLTRGGTYWAHYLVHTIVYYRNISQYLVLRKGHT